MIKDDGNCQLEKTMLATSLWGRGGKLAAGKTGKRLRIFQCHLGIFLVLALDLTFPGSSGFAIGSFCFCALFILLICYSTKFPKFFTQTTQYKISLETLKQDLKIDHKSKKPSKKRQTKISIKTQQPNKIKSARGNFVQIPKLWFKRFGRTRRCSGCS